MSITAAPRAKPFVKWVGGKRAILPELRKRMPVHYTTYAEPFVGGGALFFDTRKDGVHYVLYDTNRHLIRAYKAIRDDVARVITYLADHKEIHSKEHYYNERAALGTGHVPFDNLAHTAARFIYLNKTCFNGLYRENSEGKFNVPMGAYKNPCILDAENLRAASAVLQRTQIICSSFANVGYPLTEGSFTYFDPPYHQTFTRYTNNGFTEQNQIELADICKCIHESGGLFMLSNSDTDLINVLYKDYYVDRIEAPRSVSCKGEGRKKTTELIVRNYRVTNGLTQFGLSNEFSDSITT